MLQLSKRVLSLALVALLTACASGVTKIPTERNSSAAPIEKVVRSVTIELSEDAKKLATDEYKFNQETLRSLVESALSKQDLVQPTSTQSLAIEVTNLRIRPTFAAVMFGFMAGSDSLEGFISVKDANGNVLKKSKVNASYALGGFGGGQDSMRMNWLYEAFAKHVVAEINDTPIK